MPLNGIVYYMGKPCQLIPILCHCNCFLVAHKNPMQKLPKKPTKIWGKNLLHGQKLLESFNIILTKNFQRYPKNY